MTIALSDSGVHCMFNTYPAGTRDKLWEFYSAVRGWPMDKETWYSTDAKRIIDIQRAALLLGGLEQKWEGWKDDVNLGGSTSRFKPDLIRARRRPAKRSKATSGVL